MSSFSATFTNKKTGKTETVCCQDDYFGRHKYGYIFPDGVIKTQEQMIKEGWERDDAR